MIYNNTVHKKVIRDYWSWRSDSFDENSVQQIEWLHVFHLAAGRAGSCKILDIGTGTGFLALGFAQQGHRVTGIDISPGMLAHARAKAAMNGLQIDLLVADAENPPFSRESFDVIVSRNLLWTLCKPQTALSRWYRLLRPKGRIVLSDGIWSHAWLKGSLRRLRHSANNFLFRQKEKPVSQRFWSAYRTINKDLPHFRGIQGRQAEALLEGCGFRHPLRYEHMFSSNPYSRNGGNRFFVMAAEKE